MRQCRKCHVTRQEMSCDKAGNMSCDRKLELVKRIAKIGPNAGEHSAPRLEQRWGAVVGGVFVKLQRCAVVEAR